MEKGLLNNNFSISATKLSANVVVFTDGKDKKIGTLSVVDGEFVFNPPYSNVSSNLKDSGGLLGSSGSNYGDYLYWNNNQKPYKWAVDGEKIHLGSNAGQTGQGEYAIAIGAKAASLDQPPRSIVINASGEPLNPVKSDALYVRPVRENDREGITGVFSGVTGVSSTQPTNVLSYNTDSKEITHRELGLYNDLIDFKPNIVSNYNIIPKNDALALSGITGAVGMNLGSEEVYWNTVYAKEIKMSKNTMYVVDPATKEEMSIKYNPATLEATISNGSYTVTGVTTSQIIPGQIDANLLPFNGFSFVGKFNPESYARTANSFSDQTLYMTYNMTYDEITEPFPIPSVAPVITTNYLYQRLGGIYYTIDGITDSNGINLTFSKLTATTDLTDYDRDSVGIITSPFTESKVETFNLKNNAMLIFTVALEPNPLVRGNIDISLYWTQIEFKVPLNGITTSNIVNDAITNLKLADLSVATRNLQNASVTTDKIAPYAINNFNLNNNVITTRTIQNASVTSEKLAISAVKSDNVENGSITFAKLSPDIQKIISSTNNDISAAILETLSNEFNKVSAALEVARQETVIVNQNWEKRVLAMEEYIQVMASTYSIDIPNGVYDYNAGRQNLINRISISHLTDAALRAITLQMNVYTYNIFYGELHLYYRNRMLISKIKKNNFDTSGVASVTIDASIFNASLPVFLELYDLSSNLIFSKTINF